MARTDEAPFGSVGDWHLLRAIGRGGTATVYEACDESGRSVAVKVLHQGLSGDPLWWRRFEREALLLQRVEHPSLPVIYEVGRANGTPYLVLELLEGRSLDARLAEAPLKPNEVLRYADAVLQALEAVHAAGGVHRDLKPSNLFETEDGTIKVLDFGIAGHVDPTAEGISTTRGVLGTPAYMPPEQARGRWNMVDARSDIWALGAVMFKMLTGEYVHPASTENERLAEAMLRSARPLASVRPAIDQRLAAVVDRALAYDQEDRWPSAAAFRAAVSMVALEAGAVLPADRTRSHARGRQNRPRARNTVLAMWLSAAGLLAQDSTFRADRALSRAINLHHSGNLTSMRAVHSAAPELPEEGASVATPAAPPAVQSARARRLGESLAVGGITRRKSTATSDPLDQRLPLLRPKVAQSTNTALDRYR